MTVIGWAPDNENGKGCWPGVMVQRSHWGPKLQQGLQAANVQGHHLALVDKSQFLVAPELMQAKCVAHNPGKLLDSSASLAAWWSRWAAANCK